MTRFIMQTNRVNNLFITTLLIITFIAFNILSFLSEGTFGGGDAYYHYLFAKYAVDKPLYLLDLWAKPVFTLLALPFAQFGYTGIKVFNIIVGFAAAYYAYLTAKTLKINNTWVVVLPILFAPIYMGVMFSALTETLFSLFLIAAIYYYLKNRHLVAAVIVSFMPLVRSEGWVLIALFLLLFIFKKQYKTLPWIFTGIFIYSLVGLFVFNDFLWLFSQNPYKVSNSLYGSGSFLFYVKGIKNTFGIPSAIFIAVGFAYYAIFVVKNGVTNKSLLIEVLTILGAFVGLFLLHSLLWWKGLMSVLADDRFMIEIIPLGGLIALRGLNLIGNTFKNKWLELLLYFSFSVLVIITPFKVYEFPVKLNNELSLIKKSTEWFEKSPYAERKIFYYNIGVPIFLGINPFDNKDCQEKVFDVNQPEKDLPIGSVLFWDAHIAPNEGNLKLEKLTNNRHFKLIKVFKPDNPFKTLNNYDYQVLIFERVE